MPTVRPTEQLRSWMTRTGFARVTSRTAPRRRAAPQTHDLTHTPLPNAKRAFAFATRAGFLTWPTAYIV